MTETIITWEDILNHIRREDSMSKRELIRLYGNNTTTKLHSLRKFKLITCDSSSDTVSAIA